MTPTRRSFLRQVALAIGGFAFLPSSLLRAAPAERIHLVKRRDTLSGIAGAYGVSVKAIRQRNRLDDSAAIRIGQRLVIPDSAATDAQAAMVPLPPVSPGDGAAAIAPIVSASRGLDILAGRWTHLVVHHSGIEAGNAKAYDGAHRRRGMENGLAYHFVIGNGRDSADGLIEIGPRWPRQLNGGHVRSQTMNEHGIGICMVGNFEERRPGSKQLTSLFSLINWFRAGGLPGPVIPKVTVHRWVDINHTVCPGKQFPYDELKRRYGASAKA